MPAPISSTPASPGTMINSAIISFCFNNKAAGKFTIDASEKILAKQVFAYRDNIGAEVIGLQKFQSGNMFFSQPLISLALLNIMICVPFLMMLTSFNLLEGKILSLSPCI